MNVAAKNVAMSALRPDVEGVTRSVRLLIVENQPIVVQGLMEVLRNEEDVRICGVTASIAQAARAIQTERPDIVISELFFADGNLLNSIEAFQAMNEDLQFMIFTSRSDRAYLQRALRLRVSGFVLKSSDSEAILHALHSTRKGGVYVDPTLLGEAIGNRAGRSDALDSALSGVDESLSDREIDTLRLVAFGYSIKEIARELGISPKSIETYKARASQKLGLTSRASIVRHAFARGWFDDENSAFD